MAVAPFKMAMAAPCSSRRLVFSTETPERGARWTDSAEGADGAKELPKTGWVILFTAHPSQKLVRKSCPQNWLGRKTFPEDTDLMQTANPMERKTQKQEQKKKKTNTNKNNKKKQ